MATFPDTVFALALAAARPRLPRRLSIPDSRLSPFSAVASTDRTEVCSPGYARARRVWNDKASTLAKYDIPMSRIREFEVTSRLELGG